MNMSKQTDDRTSYQCCGCFFFLRMSFVQGLNETGNQLLIMSNLSLVHTSSD